MTLSTASVSEDVRPRDRPGARSGGRRVLTGRALGSPLRLTLSDTDDVTAASAWSEVLEEFAAVDAALSNYREDSAVSTLNRRSTRSATAQVAAQVDGRLYSALALSERAWRMTGGRFDPRVGAALQRLGRSGPVRLAIAPGDPGETIGGWMRRGGRTRTVATTQPLDLAGIGKGLALRWAWRRVARVLAGRRSGALLECGGDLVGRGPGPDEPSWLIAIEDPHAAESMEPDTEAPERATRSSPLAVIALAEGAVCTSSTRLGRWHDGDGRAIHHLIDPVTRLPGGDGLLAVTVAWPDPAWAEVWTKELFLAGAGIASIARRRDLAAWWVTADGGLEMTPRARQLTRWP